MSIYDRLASSAAALSIEPEQSSYFSTPEDHLDPALFRGDYIFPDVRQGILSLLHSFWETRYHGQDQWSTVWLAGSGVSYQWSAARDPGDLDCLIGVDWVSFRRSNPDFVDLSDDEIADHMNQELHDQLWPTTAMWRGYELTFYVNPGGTNIVDIHPYAAYNLTLNLWTVRPDPNPRGYEGPGMEVVEQDAAKAQKILEKYNKAREALETSSDPSRLDDAIHLRNALREGSALFDDIHHGRNMAFGPGGNGYQDIGEYRYKGSKATGVSKLLREMRAELSDADSAEEESVYGTHILDASHALVASALSRRFRG